MPRPTTLTHRWIRHLREWRAELAAQRAWRRALQAESFTDWDSLSGRRHFALFPHEEVSGCREDLALQAQEDAAGARARFLRRSRPCFGCQSSAESLEWIFFQSPVWTWVQRCGRAGWIVYCAACDNQVSFHRTRMS